MALRGVFSKTFDITNGSNNGNGNVFLVFNAQTYFSWGLNETKFLSPYKKTFPKDALREDTRLKSRL